MCGLVCPSAELCRRDCNCGKLGESIRISDLQAYAMRRAVARGAAAPEAVPQQSGRVAVIGGGPSGVVAAALLRAKGYGVTLFEKADHLGGVPMDEIPNDRLDKALFQKEIEQLLGGGVEVRLVPPSTRPGPPPSTPGTTRSIWPAAWASRTRGCARTRAAA